MLSYPPNVAIRDIRCHLERNGRPNNVSCHINDHFWKVILQIVLHYLHQNRKVLGPWQNIQARRNRGNWGGCSPTDFC